MMRNVLRICRRQLHTIVSRDIIKPSSPTPSHLKTYNLSLLDQLAVKAYMPVVAFYPNSNIFQSSQKKTCELKSSLSQTLTQYYPFAGRIKNYGQIGRAYVDCNDEGTEFIEAFIDTPVLDFLQNSKHEDLDQLFPNDLIWYKSNNKSNVNDGSKSVSPLTVQVNHFACGGVAVAISLSHILADGSSVLNFINHWATTTRSCFSPQIDLSYIKPHFLRHQTRNINLPKKLHDRPTGDCVTRSFVFPNSKINILKAKVTAMTKDSCQPIVNPTRAEALTWLFQKCSLAAASKTNTTGTLNQTGVCQMLNIRNKLVKRLPETSVGNLCLLMEVPTTEKGELAPETLISELRKRKMEYRRITDVETALGMFADKCCNVDLNEWLNRLDQYYLYSVLYSFPTYGIDFGWGKPIKVTCAGVVKNFIVLLDAPNGDGIEALVSLEKQDMKIVQEDPELLAFCQVTTTQSL